MTCATECVTSKTFLPNVSLLIFHIIIIQDDFQGDLCVWKGGRKMNFSCRDTLIKINRLIKGGEVTALHLMHMTISGEGKNFENAVFKVYFWKFATLNVYLLFSAVGH